jgi:hypothetical protein
MKLALLVLLAAVGVVVVASPVRLDITGRTPLSSQAAKDVRLRAENAVIVMSRGTSESPVEQARRVVGGTVEDAQIELMSAEGDTGRGEVVLRIRSTFGDDGPWGNSSTALACYRYELNSRSGIRGPDEVDCPEGSPMVLPPPPFDPELPSGAERLLAAALAEPDPQGAVRAAFELPGLAVDTTTVDGIVGAAVQASPGECVAGRRLADGTVEAWHVPRIVAMPGELGCDADAAVDAGSARSPH